MSKPASVPVELVPFRRGRLSGAYLPGPAPAIFLDWVDALEASVATPGGDPASVARLIHDGRNRVVRAEAPPSWPGWPSCVVVKRFGFSRGWDRLRTLFRASKAVRSHRAAFALRAAGLHAPRSFAFWERRVGGMVTSAAWVSADLGDGPTLRDALAGEAAPQPAMLYELGREIARMNRSRVRHADLSDGNVLLERRDGERPVRFWFVDLNRARVGRPVRRWAGLGELVRIGARPGAEQRSLVEGYFGAEDARRWWLPYRFRKRWFLTWLELKRRLRFWRC